MPNPGKTSCGSGGASLATDAGQRLTEAAVLGPRRTLTGQPLAPVLAATATAQAAGLINGEHVDKIRDAMDRIPGFVDTPTREQIETDLVRLAVGVGPTELKKAADRVLFLLDQDGPEPDDTERARKRGLHCRSPTTRRHGAGQGLPHPRSLGDL